MTFTVWDFFSKYAKHLQLELFFEGKAKEIAIRTQEVERPGLMLAGYLRSAHQKRILVFGRAEMEYLKDLPEDVRKKRLVDVITSKIPAVILTRNYRPIEQIFSLCKEHRIPILRTKLPSMKLLSHIAAHLTEELAPTTSRHATLVEVFGTGVLIEGDSSVGKSETALAMIERGHRLVSDDVVLIKRVKDTQLEGTGPELTRHLLEIRGIGIINVAHLYGAVCVSESKQIDLIVQLQLWNEEYFYDRIGLEEQYQEILDVSIPFYLMPVKPGRDVALLLETIVLNHRLKKMGYHSAKEFNEKLRKTIFHRQKVMRDKNYTTKLQSLESPDMQDLFAIKEDTRN